MKALLALMLLSAASQAFAAAGTTAGEFLKLGVSARATGMGEAYSAVAEGPDALYWNPAGLSNVRKKSVSLMHAAYRPSFFYDYVSYAHPLGKTGGLGAGIQYFSSNSADETDAFGNTVGSFRLSDMALSLGYGSSLNFSKGGKYQWGLGAKFIQSKVVQSDSTFALDFGAQWLPNEKSRLGLSAQNLFGKLKYGGEARDLPGNFKLGYAIRPWKPLLLAADLNLPRARNPHVNVGSEYRMEISPGLSLAGMAGYKSQTLSRAGGLSSFSFGLGLGWNNSSLDFAWLPMGALGNSFHVSLGFQFGSARGSGAVYGPLPPAKAPVLLPPPPVPKKAAEKPKAETQPESAPAKKIVVAFLGLLAQDVPGDELEKISNSLKKMIDKKDGLTLVEDENVKSKVEPQLIRLAAFDLECAQLAGHAVGADKVILGSLEKSPGNGYSLKISAFDVKSKRLEYTAETAPESLQGFERYLGEMR